MSSNAYGNDARGVRKFLRENGVRPDASNTERIGKELRRTESQNEALVKQHKEMERERGVASIRDERGRDMKQVVKGIVERQIAARRERR